MVGNKKVIVIVPAYNVENEIASIVSRALNFSKMVIVVTDGSTDNTRQRASKAGAVVPPQQNVRGKGNAVRKGIEASKKKPSDIIVLMDADGQHLPEEIPELVAPIIENGYDIVVGSRIMGQLKTSSINILGNFGLKIISFLVTSRWISDTESGFRAFKTKCLYSLSLSSKRYEIESELLIKCLKKGFSYKEVPITVPKAVPGVTVMDGIRNGFYKIKYAIQR